MTPETFPDGPDRRQAQRHRLAVPVKLGDGHAITRDISAAGVFFETEQSMTRGQSIALSLIFEHVPVRLHCQGEVVRVEPGERTMGVGAMFTTYHFEPLDHGSAPAWT